MGSTAAPGEGSEGKVIRSAAGVRLGAGGGTLPERARG